MSATIEKMYNYCQSNNIGHELLDDNRLQIQLPDQITQGIVPNRCATIEYFPMSESLRISCALGVAYGSKLTQALRLNNILSNSSLSVIRQNGQDHFNLIFWKKVTSETEDEYSLNPILDFISEEMGKIRPAF